MVCFHLFFASQLWSTSRREPSGLAGAPSLKLETKQMFLICHDVRELWAQWVGTTAPGSNDCIHVWWRISSPFWWHIGRLGLHAALLWRLCSSNNFSISVMKGKTVNVCVNEAPLCSCVWFVVAVQRLGTCSKVSDIKLMSPIARVCLYVRFINCVFWTVLLHTKTEWKQYPCKFLSELYTTIPGKVGVGSKLGILNTISCGCHAWRSKWMLAHRTKTMNSGAQWQGEARKWTFGSIEKISQCVAQMPLMCSLVAPSWKVIRWPLSQVGISTAGKRRLCAIYMHSGHWWKWPISSFWKAVLQELQLTRG